MIGSCTHWVKVCSFNLLNLELDRLQLNGKDGEVSQCFLEDVLGTKLSLVVAICILFYDIGTKIRWPTALVRLNRSLSLPFQNFIRSADLVRMKQNCKDVRVSSWKIILLLLMAVLQATVSLALTTYTFITLGYFATATLIGLLSWVSERFTC